MENHNSSVPVEELIRRYNQELLEFQRRNAAISSRQVPVQPPSEQQLDREFPLPNIERDLQMMRDEQENTFISPSAAEENAVGNESEGQNEAPEIPPPTQNTPSLTPEEETLPPSEPPPMEMSTGYLRAFVTTGRGVLPIPNAQVIVTRVFNEEELLEQAARTDNSGYSPLFALPAVSSIYSQTPGNASPYTFYTMYVRANGFYPIRLRNIPLYGGITATQPIDLVPVAEGDDPNKERTITEGAPENLL